MQKPILAALALGWVVALLATGCDDGPSDSYSPSPPGAQYNNPHGTFFVSDASAPFAQADGAPISTGGQTKVATCNAQQVATANNTYFAAPIAPNLGCGIDLRGGVNQDGKELWNPATNQIIDNPVKVLWEGTTVQEAEAFLCQSTADTIFYGLTNTAGWGNDYQCSVEYNTNNRIITDILIQTGYIGTVEADTSNGLTHYSIAFQNSPPTKATRAAVGGALGQPQTIIINWSDSAALASLATDLYDALRSTYNPNLPAETNCVATGHCILGNNGSGGGYFWFTPINMAFFVNTTLGDNIANSTFTLLDIGQVKTLGFSTASNLLKLDALGEGPVGTQLNVNGTTKTCVYKFGQLYSDFRDNCVETFTDPTKNLIEQNKLFGGISHTDETVTFDVQGVDPNFAATTIAPDTVVGDSYRPADGDTVYEYTVDQEVLGPIANDFTNNDTTQPQDFHGIGLVTLETAFLLQKDLTTTYGVTAALGDPECIAAPFRTAAQRGAAATAGKICSGLEGIVTTAPPSAVTGQLTVNALGPAIVATGNFNALEQGLKPGTWYAYTCLDGQGLDVTGVPVGYANCTQNYYFSLLAAAVQGAYSGNGGSAPPTRLNDLGFYFQDWILALIKYFQVADVPNSTLAAIDAQPVSVDDLFFDTAGGGFEFGEYVDPVAVNAGKVFPTDLNITTNLLTSVINDFQFTRYLFRGERALYTSFVQKKGDLPGSEPFLLSNLVGSTVLASAYGSYACAINTDPTSAACTSGGLTLLAPTDNLGNPLLDDQGNPLFTKYQNAFASTNFTLPALGDPPTETPITISKVDTYISSAMISLPYDPTSATPNGAPINVLLPYLPKSASVGFPVTIDTGQRDKFVDTYNLDFSGVNITASLDFDYLYGDSGEPISIITKAIETQDFLGAVFVCAEPSITPYAVANANTLSIYDVLAVRMFQPTQDILDWFVAHPNGLTDCDVVYKYSPYANYPDYITARAFGIRLGSNPQIGGGAGRITDVTVFDPNVVASLGE
jgi:hypothetical protein